MEAMESNNRVIALFYHEPEGDPLVILPPQIVNEATYQLLIQEFNALKVLEEQINKGLAPRSHYDASQIEDILAEYCTIHRGDRIYGLRCFLDTQELVEYFFDEQQYVGIVDEYNVLEYIDSHDMGWDDMHDKPGFFTSAHSNDDGWTFGMSAVPPTINSLL